MDISEIPDKILRLAEEQRISKYNLSGKFRTNKGGMQRKLSKLREGKGICVSSLERLATCLNRYPVCVHDDSGKIIPRQREVNTSEYLRASLGHMMYIKQISQERLAKKTGKDQSTISAVLNYCNDYSLKTISDFLTATGATLEYLTDTDPSA